MNKISILGIAVCLAACGTTPSDSNSEQTIEVVKSQDDIILENIEAALIDRLNDPTTYEFVSLTKEKVITLGDNIEYRRDLFSGILKSSNEAENAAFDAVFDSLSGVYANELDRVIATNYVIEYRASNALGATILDSAFVQVAGGGGNEIWQVGEERKNLSNNPTDIPNWVSIYQGVKAKFPRQ